MANIAIIIPVHEYNDTVKTYLNTALNSIPQNMNIYISCPRNISSLIVTDVAENIEILDGATDTSFQALVNYAVNNIEDCDWFSILEFDDTYTNYWFDEVNKYIDFYPETSIFLPLTDLMQEHDGKINFVGYGNEAPLASAFSNELEFIDFDVLESYFDFYLTGSVFNKADFLNVGGLKESMKLTFWYEFLLRLTNSGKKVRTIPKVGYHHLINRPNSLYTIYRDTIDEDEGKWWYDLARDEYRFNKDRNKQYEKEED